MAQTAAWSLFFSMPLTPEDGTAVCAPPPYGLPPTLRRFTPRCATAPRGWARWLCNGAPALARKSACKARRGASPPDPLNARQKWPARFSRNGSCQAVLPAVPTSKRVGITGIPASQRAGHIGGRVSLPPKTPHRHAAANGLRAAPVAPGFEAQPVTPGACAPPEEGEAFGHLCF